MGIKRKGKLKKTKCALKAVRVSAAAAIAAGAALTFGSEVEGLTILAALVALRHQQDKK